MPVEKEESIMRWQTAQVVPFLTVLLLLGPPGPSARTAEMSPQQARAVQKGLEWLARTQHKDGHWAAFGAQYPISMTALSGMAMLMEGSTLRDGVYRDNLQRATAYLMAQSRPNGLISDVSVPGESGRYMHGHGFAVLFLSCVVGDEDDAERRGRLVDVLERACQFSRDAQTTRGGWGYVSAREGNNYDEGSVTVTQVQALRAARNAGIRVPPQAITLAQKYLSDSTNNEGGVIYSLAGACGKDGRPALTAAAIACGFSLGDYDSPLIKKWFKFCQQTMPLLGDGGFGHDEYAHYYYSQAVYMLGEDRYGELFPEAKESDRVKWSTYRKTIFETILRSQSADGSWSGGHVGPAYITPVYLSILQLENAALPLYQR
jgi:Prenyltransferase and squalene oxidase repeat